MYQYDDFTLQNIISLFCTHNHHKHHGAQVDDEEEEGDHG